MDYRDLSNNLLSPAAGVTFPDSVRCERKRCTMHVNKEYRFHIRKDELGMACGLPAADHRFHEIFAHGN